MIIAEGRDVLRHDFHAHSLQSACGIHSVAEILDIAAQKGVETVTLCDHGEGAGRKMNFGVLADPRRTPRRVTVATGSTTVPIRLLPGIEANISDDGGTDLPLDKLDKPTHRFSLISAGFHATAKKLQERRDPAANLKALRHYAEHYPIDILTHPCTRAFPLPIPELVRLAGKHGIALEVDNANLVVEKTNLDLLAPMILEARAQGVTLLANSDGHAWHGLFECGAVRAFVEGKLKLPMEEVFPLNFGDWQQVLERFPRCRRNSE